jgi:predicted DCC family thiol-disulfide oxidoreductase YuxK
MESLTDKTLLYDGNCAMCTNYTQAFVKMGMLKPSARVSLCCDVMELLAIIDTERARHEIPMLDSTTGEVLYGVDAIAFIAAANYKWLGPLANSQWVKTAARPLYNFISYNRRIIAGTPNNAETVLNFAPRFDLFWRLLLIVTGISYTGLCIYAFSVIANIQNIVMMFASVFMYFLLLLGTNIAYNKTTEQKWDYIGHLAVLGVIEGSLFIITALAARTTGMVGLLFAGQGAGRLLAWWLHAKRVSNNGYSPKLNVAFGMGALLLIVYLAYIIK